MHDPLDKAPRVLRAVGAVFAAAALLTTAACSTGDDAVAQNQSNQFVSPGGKLVLDYAPDERRDIDDVAGPELLSGDRVKVSDYRDQVVVLNVWASWCAPCRTEFRELEAVFEKTKAQGVQFLGIDFRDTKSTAQDFVRDRKVTYPSIYDYGGASLAPLGVPVGAVPTTVILDRKHRPAKVFLKAITEKELHDAVLAVVNEPR